MTISYKEQTRKNVVKITVKSHGKRRKINFVENQITCYPQNDIIFLIIHTARSQTGFGKEFTTRKPMRPPFLFLRGYKLKIKTVYKHCLA